MEAPGRPWWWRGAAPRPPLPEAPPERCEFLVIGAGYTGLSAARTLARAGADVCVIDAGEPGEGASTRNGGMLGAHARLAPATLVARYGEETARALIRESAEAFDFTRALIADEGIDCALQITGRIQLASTPAALARLEQAAEDLARLGAGGAARAEFVPPARLGEHLSSACHLGGLFYPAHGGLDPRRFHDGLLRAALAAGASVVPRAPAIALAAGPGGFLVETPRGAIRARRVLLATNGLTGAPFAWHARRIIPVPSFIIVTDEIDPALLDRLAPGRRMMVETAARHGYWRLTPDGRRVLFGGRAGLVPLGPRLAARRLRRFMAAIWPELAEVGIAASWRGTTGFTFAQMPHIGRVGGIDHAMGYSGSGVALAPWLGHKLALRALGDPAGRSAFERTGFEGRWWYPAGGWPWFLAPAEIWYRQIVDRIEARQAAAARRRLGLE